MPSAQYTAGPQAALAQPDTFPEDLDHYHLLDAARAARRPHGELRGRTMFEAKTRTTPRALVERIVNGAGTASHDLRVRVFNNEKVPEALRGLIDKVATRPALITDADFARAAAAGFDDDELFELVICAAVGQANRQHEAAVAALADAAAGQGND